MKYRKARNTLKTHILEDEDREVPILVWYDFYPEEPQTRDHEGAPEQVEVVRIEVLSFASEVGLGCQTLDPTTYGHDEDLMLECLEDARERQEDVPE